MAVQIRERFNAGEQWLNFRHSLNLTRPAFATKFGVSANTLRGWEEGRGTPSAKAMQRLEELKQGCQLTSSGESHAIQL